jgi:hypothetical protein
LLLAHDQMMLATVSAHKSSFSIGIVPGNVLNTSAETQGRKALCYVSMGSRVVREAVFINIAFSSFLTSLVLVVAMLMLDMLICK